MAITRTFTLKTLPEDVVFRGQQKLIVDHMKANPGQTVEQIAEGIKPSLQTRQDPSRVVAYYMTTWKKKGWVAVQGVESPEGSTAETADVSPVPDDDDRESDDESSDGDAAIDEESAISTGASIEERAEAAHEADLQAHSIRSEESKTVSERVLDQMVGPGPFFAGDLASYLGLKNNQVLSALGNLVRRGQVRKVGSGYEVVA